MSAHDDEFPIPSDSAWQPPEKSSIPKIPFGIKNEVLVTELRQLADAIEAGEVFPQEFVRTQRDLIDDFKMFTLAVTFGSPVQPSELQS